jgi:hypothetical protein
MPGTNGRLIDDENFAVLRVKISRDTLTGLPRLGFWIGEAFVSRPNLAADGVTPVDALSEYGISSEEAVRLDRLNAALEAATAAARHEGAYLIQTAMGVETGDMAGVYFSGPNHVYDLAETFAKYMLFELNLAEDDYVE